MSFSYLASPYSHPSPLVREQRYLYAAKVLADLLVAGEVVFSPIVHAHELAKIFPFPKGFDYWERIDLNMLEKADKLYVLRIEGWESSVGLKAEIEFAFQRKIPVVYI